MDSPLRSYSPPPSPTAVSPFKGHRSVFHSLQVHSHPLGRQPLKPTFVDPFTPSKKNDHSALSSSNEPAAIAPQWRERRSMDHRSSSHDRVVFDGTAAPDYFHYYRHHRSAAPPGPPTPPSHSTSPSHSPLPPIPALPPPNAYTSSLAPPVPHRSLRRRSGNPNFRLDSFSNASAASPPLFLAASTRGGRETSGEELAAPARAPLESPVPVRPYARGAIAPCSAADISSPSLFLDDNDGQDLRCIAGFFPAPPPRPSLKLRVPAQQVLDELPISPFDSPTSSDSLGVPTPTTPHDDPPATIGLGLRIQLDDLQLPSTFTPEFTYEGEANEETSYYFSRQMEEGQRLSCASSVNVSGDSGDGTGEGWDEGAYDPFDLRRFLRRLSSTHEYNNVEVKTGEESAGLAAHEVDPLGNVIPSQTETTSIGHEAAQRRHSPLWSTEQLHTLAQIEKEEHAGQRGVVDWSRCLVDGFLISPNTTHLSLSHTLSAPSALNNLLFASLGYSRETLVVLDLSSCNLASPPSTLSSLRSLRRLDLSSNPLSPSSLAQLRVLSSLQILLLSSCRLTTVPSAIAALRELHTLDLRDNHLVTLPSWLCRLQVLDVLLVEGNSFHSQLDDIVKPTYLAMSPAAPENPTNPLTPGPQGGFLHIHGDDHGVGAHGRPEGSFHCDSPASDLPPSYHAAMRSLFAYLRDLDDLTPLDSASLARGRDLLGFPPVPAIQPTRPTLTRAQTSPSFRMTTPSAPSTPAAFPVSLHFPHITLALHSAPSFASIGTSTTTSSFGFSSPPTPSFSPFAPAPPLPLSPPIPLSSAASDASDASATQRRLATLREILSTESTYIRQLEELHCIYVASSSPYSTSSSSSPTLPAREWKLLFSSIEPIRDFHRNVLFPELVAAAAGEDEHLAADKVDEGSRRAAGRVAKVFAKRGPFLRIYSSHFNSDTSSLLSRITSWTTPTFSSRISFSAPPSPSISSVSLGRDRSISSPRLLRTNASPSALEQVLAAPLPSSASSSYAGPTGEAQLTNQQKKRIQSWLKKCRSHPSHSQISLSSYLLLPIQRIPRYRLLLESLLACTPPRPSHHGLSPYAMNTGYPFRSSTPTQEEDAHEKLVSAVRLMQDLGTFLNESKREAEGRQELVRWQGRIVSYEQGEGRRKVAKMVKVVEPWRGVIKVGEVVLSRSVRRVPNDSLGGEDEEQLFTLAHDSTKVHLIALLCNDILLFLIPPSSVPLTSSHPYSSAGPGFFELHSTVKLAELSMGGRGGPPAEVFGYDGMLRLATPTQIHYLRFPTLSPSSSSSPSPSLPSHGTSSPSLSGTLDARSSSMWYSPRDEAIKQAKEWEDAVNGAWRKEVGCDASGDEC